MPAVNHGFHWHQALTSSRDVMPRHKWNPEHDVCGWRDFRYIMAMKWLTKQEQLVVCGIIALLLTGLAVKYYRATHPAGLPPVSARP